MYLLLLPVWMVIHSNHLNESAQTSPLLSVATGKILVRVLMYAGYKCQ